MRSSYSFIAKPDFSNHFEVGTTLLRNFEKLIHKCNLCGKKTVFHVFSDLGINGIHHEDSWVRTQTRPHEPNKRFCIFASTAKYDCICIRSFKEFVVNRFPGVFWTKHYLLGILMSQCICRSWKDC